MKIYFAVSGLAYGLFLERLISESGSKYLYFWCSYIIIVLAYQTLSFYYLFYLEFIHHELCSIDFEIRQLLVDCNAKNWIKTKQFIKRFHCTRLKWIRGYYGLIYNLSETMNSVFGWSNVVTLLLSFEFVLTEINWFYWKLLNKYELRVMGNMILI